MLPEGLNLEDVDPGIRDLVVAINELPFVETLSSYEGNVKSYTGRAERYGAREIGRDGRKHIYFMNGYLTFQTDDSNMSAPLFIGQVEDLANQYHFAHFRPKHATTPEEYNYKYEFKFPLGTGSEYALELTANDIDYGDSPAFQGRKQDFNAVWKEFARICRDYSSGIYPSGVVPSS